MGSPSYADIALDIIPLFDVLLRDLGLPANRKGCVTKTSPLGLVGASTGAAGAAGASSSPNLR